MLDLSPLYAAVNARQDDALETLYRLIRQPSISAQGVGVPECGALVREIMAANGIASELLDAGGYPAIYGRVDAPDAACTILVYGHYDVQPPEPLDLWHSPPFEPTVRDGNIYGRGTGDNKGQFLCHILAVGQLLRTYGRVPCNVVFLIEGEEEIGSRTLPALIERHLDRFADAILTYCSDGPAHATGRPLIALGVRGVVGMEITVRGANSDLHSGNFGNIVPNAAWRLVQLLATMQDAEGNITIDGVMDSVVPPTADETAILASLPFDTAAYAESVGLPIAAVRSPVEHFSSLFYRPTMTINGLTSGYQGKGGKTVIPSVASAKLDMRLVPDQDPDAILAAVRAHVARYAPDAEVQSDHGTPPSATPAMLPVSQTVIAAVREASGQEPVVYPRMGATDPEWVFTRTLGLPTINVPYAPHDEHNHAPDEHTSVAHFLGGIKTSATVFARVAEWHAGL